MPKRPRGKISPSADSSPESFREKPRRKVLNVSERHALRAAAMQLFVNRCGRRARSGLYPNDRHYGRETVDAVRRMRPEDLDALLHGDGEG